MKRILSAMIAVALALALATTTSHDAEAQTAPPRSSTPTGAAAPRTNRPNAAPRMLEDIHIEGEVPVPQVLFVTAQDQRRFLESHHRRYLRTSLEIGRATSMPDRIRLTRSGTPLARGSAQ